MIAGRDPAMEAFTTLDCANKRRVHYVLGARVTREFLSQFTDADVRIDEFSKTVSSAEDHFTLVMPGMMKAAGVIGGNTVVATYGRDHDSAMDTLQSEFEERLRRLESE